jgi:hypothetical protein
MQQHACGGLNGVRVSKNGLQSVSLNIDVRINAQPRSQGFSLFVIGKAGKGPGTGRSSMYSDWSMTSTLLCK